MQACPSNSPAYSEDPLSTSCQREVVARVLAIENDDFGDSSDSEPPPSKPPAVCVQNAAHFIESFLISETEPLPQKHPLSKWLYEVFEEMYPDEENVVIYLTPKQSVDAFCLGNGTIFVSKGLVDLCGSKEALQFVLGHEYNHIRRGHFTYDEDDRDDDRFNSLFEAIGIQRLHEYEGDLGSVKDMDETGINPYGAIDFFRRMIEASKSRGCVSPGLAHGNLEDRLLNVETVLNVKDSKELSQELATYSEEIKVLLSQITEQPPQVLGKRENLHKDLSLIPNLSYGQLLAFFDHLRRLDLSLAPDFERQSLEDCYKAAFVRLSTLANAQRPYSNKKTHELASSLLARLATPVGFAATSFGIPVQFFPARFMSESEDPKALIAALDPAFFDSVGAYCIANPLYFAKETMKTLLQQNRFQQNDHFDQAAYQEYTRELYSALQTLYAERGAVPMPPAPLWNAQLDKLVTSDFQPQKACEVSQKLSLAAFAPHLTAGFNSAVITRLDQIANGEITVAEVGPWLKARVFDEIIDDLNTCNRLALKVLSDPNAEIVEKSDFKVPQKFHEDKLKEPGVYLYAYRLRESLNQFNLQVLTELRQAGHFVNLKTMFDFFERSGCRVVFDWNSRYSELESNPLLVGLPIFFKPPKDSKTPVLLQGGIEEMCEIHEAYFSPDRPDRPDLPVSDVPTEIWWHYTTVCLLSDLEVADKSVVTRSLAHLIKADSDFAQYFSRMVDNDGSPKIDSFLNKLFETHSLDLAHNPEDARLLFYSSFLMESPYLSSMSQSVAMRTLVATMGFEDGRRFFFEELKRPPYAFEAIQTFIESRVCTHAQFEEVRALAEAKLKEGLDPEKIGKMALADTLIELLGGRNSRRELYQAFSMSESDLELKTLIAIAKTACTDWVFEDCEISDSEKLPPLIYRSLLTADDTLKYFLTRKLLVGPKGILSLKGERSAFLRQLLAGEIQIPQNGQDRKLLDFLKKLLERVADIAEFDQLYFMLAPLITRRLLVPPPKRATWEEALWGAAERIQPEWAEYEIHEMTGSYHETDSGSIQNRVDWAEGKWQTDPVACHFVQLLPQLKAQGVFKGYPKVAKEIPGKEGLLKQFRYVLEYYSGFLYPLCPSIAERIKNEAEVLARNEGDEGAEQISYNNAVMKLIEGSSHRVEKTKLNVFDFVLEVAQNLGSPGIRFLQLLGQYVELPPHLEASIAQVYDKVHGQNKLAAYHLVEREWPEFKDQVAEMRASVGGGSLMTVYETKMVDGEKRVLKVLNPNAEEKTREIYELMYKVFEAMGPEYVDALPLIEEIQEWIHHDICFEGNLDQDKKFREANHGFSDGSGYSIMVPCSFEPASKYFKMEEFVEGRNMTDLEGLRQEGHDSKKIVSLLVRNYLQQIQNGLVHSDVHPGNFRVTADRQVAILDRNFALEFSPVEIEKLGVALMSMGDPSVLTERVVDIVMSEEADQDRKSLVEAVQVAIQDSSTPLEQMKQAILTLKKRGVKVPLKFTLLFKNVFALDHMAKKVGFPGGVTEALLAA